MVLYTGFDLRVVLNKDACNGVTPTVLRRGTKSRATLMVIWQAAVDLVRQI